MWKVPVGQRHTRLDLPRVALEAGVRPTVPPDVELVMPLCAEGESGSGAWAVVGQAV